MPWLDDLLSQDLARHEQLRQADVGRALAASADLSQAGLEGRQVQQTGLTQVAGEGGVDAVFKHSAILRKGDDCRKACELAKLPA